MDQEEVQVDPRFYTLEQTARYLNVSRPQVYSLVRSGELPAIKLGGRGVWRVDRHQLDVYISRAFSSRPASGLCLILYPRSGRINPDEAPS